MSNFPTPGPASKGTDSATIAAQRAALGLSSDVTGASDPDWTPPTPSADGPPLVDVVAVSTAASGALVIGKHNPLDATAGALARTLANAPAAGLITVVEKTDATANMVTITLNLRGTPGATIGLALQHETVEFLSRADGSWWPISGHKTLSSLLSTFSPTAQVAPRLVVVGDNGIGTGLFGSSTSTAGTSEHYFTVGTAASGIAAEFQHWESDATFKDIDPSTSLIFNASIKVIASGTIYRLTFGGRTTATLDPGGRIISDTLGLDVAVGDVIAVRTFLSSGTAYAPRSTRGNTAFGGFTATTDLTAPGSAAISNGSSYSYGPAALLGFPSTTAPKSVLILGDSIARSRGDGTAGDGGYIPSHQQISGGGYLVRAITGKGGAINAALGGDSAQKFAVSDGRFRRMSLASRCSSAIIEYGVNDISSGRTPTQLQTDLLTIATACRKFGITRIFLTTITPVTTSTDGWATTANQTPNANNGNRVTHNNWVRGGSPIDPAALTPVAVGTAGALLAGALNHPISGYFEVADTVESARDSGKWKVANRVVTDAALTSTTTALTSATAAFNSALNSAGGDVGSTYWLAGAGAAGAALVDYIAAVGSATAATTQTAGSTTVSGSTLNIGVKTVDGTHPSTDGHMLASAAINVALL